MKYLELIKYKHFIKSAIIWLPFVLSLNEINVAKSFFDLFLFTFLFCFINQSVYMINDFFDRYKDSATNKKNIYIKFNELKLSKHIYLYICILFIFAPLILIAFTSHLSNEVLNLTIIYFMFTTLYTIILKKIIFIDIISLSCFYGIRLTIGIELVNLNLIDFIFQIILICLASTYVISIKRIVGFNSSYSIYKKDLLNQILVSSKYIFLIACFIFLYFKNLSYFIKIDSFYFYKIKSIILFLLIYSFIKNYEKMLKNNIIDYDIVNNFLKRKNILYIISFGAVYIL